MTTTSTITPMTNAGPAPAATAPRAATAGDALLDPAAEWAGLLMATLARAGVRDVVVSPGSRSTPFVLAALRTPGLRVHDVIDERAAGFFALGQARATGSPSVCLCTSGTAAAHYLPAIVEASRASVPLIVLTADRPLALQACAAAQTIDQVKLYGGFVRAAFDLGAADGREAGLLALRRTTAQAVARARGPHPGPVHLEARADKPLEPRPARDDGERALARRARALADEGPTWALAATGPALPREGIAELAVALARAARPLFVAAPAPLGTARARAELAAIARATGAALFADVASQLRLGAREEGAPVDGAEALLRLPAARRALEPDLVVELGGAPTSSAWERWVTEHPRVPRWVIAPHEWADPHGTAAALVQADVAEAVAALAGALADAPARAGSSLRGWLERAGGIARRVIEEALARTPRLSELEATRLVARALPDGALLQLGNSLPIRHADLILASDDAQGVGVLSQRGANGIDGLVAGAAGAACASGRPTALLVGDVSLAHDVGSLPLAARVTAPLAIIVLDNNGGRIFEQLPIASALDEGAARAAVMGHFLTPPRIDLQAAAQMGGVAYVRVGDEPTAAARGSLSRALASALGRVGATLIHVVVPPDGAAALDRAIAAELGAALRAAGLLIGEGDR
jgi:2-succinyl-5-enolpyruvyl-6-hydroxy-3-cyclohexene-1-carboxylate synthase